MFYALDRITEGWAVLVGDDGGTLRLPQDALPPGTREGDVLRLDEDGFSPAPEEAEARRRRITEKLDALLRPRGEQ